MNRSFAAGMSPAQPHPAPGMPVAQTRSPSLAGQRQPSSESAGRTTRTRGDCLPTALLSYARAFDTLQLTAGCRAGCLAARPRLQRIAHQPQAGSLASPVPSNEGKNNSPVLPCSKTNIAESEVLANAAVSQNICALMQKLIFAIEEDQRH